MTTRLLMLCLLVATGFSPRSRTLKNAATDAATVNLEPATLNTAASACERPVFFWPRDWLATPQNLAGVLAVATNALVEQDTDVNLDDYTTATVIQIADGVTLYSTNRATTLRFSGILAAGESVIFSNITISARAIIHNRHGALVDATVINFMDYFAAPPFRARGFVLYSNQPGSDGFTFGGGDDGAASTLYVGIIEVANSPVKYATLNSDVNCHGVTFIADVGPRDGEGVLTSAGGLLHLSHCAISNVPNRGLAIAFPGGGAAFVYQSQISGTNVLKAILP